MASIMGSGITVEFDAVLTERVSRSGTITSAPIEGNLTVNDHFARGQVTISISGVCTTDGANKVANLTKLYTLGNTCTYVGRNWLGNVVITKFDTDHGGQYEGGFSFTMSLTSVRISSTQEFTYQAGTTAAQDSAQRNKETNVGTQQATNRVTDAATTANTLNNVTAAVNTYG